MSGFKNTTALCLSLGLILPIGASAATKTINKVTYDSEKLGSKSSSVDASLRLKKVFLFPSLDDLSGVLSPKLDEKLVQLFQRNPRFNLVRDPQVLKALSPDESGYAKAAVNQEVHREAARVTQSDTTAILRTRNVGSQTEMTLDLRDAEGEILFSETGSIPGFSAMEARWGLIEKLFQTVLAKIPFDGTVTGRTASTLTIDLGSMGIKRGEDVDLVRIVSVQRHPLLKTIVGTDYVRVGRAKITSVDRALSFADVTEEFPGEMVSAGAKVLRTGATQIHRSSEPQPEAYSEVPVRKAYQNDVPFEEVEDRLKGEFDRRKPRYGQVGLSLQYGSLTHSETVSGTATEYSGSGLGGNIEGELWVTKHWIFTMLYGFQSATLAGNGVTAGDSSWKRIEGFGGYRFFPDEIVDGAQLTGSLGYQVQDFTVPTPAGTTVSGKRYAGLALKLDAEILLLPNHKISTGFGFQPFSSVTDNGASPGSPDGGTVIGFHLGWNYRVSDLFWAKVGMQYDTASGSYTNGANVSDKRFAIGPGIAYSF